MGGSYFGCGVVQAWFPLDGPRFELIVCLLSRGDLFTARALSFNNLYQYFKKLEQILRAWLPNMHPYHEYTLRSVKSRTQPAGASLISSLPPQTHRFRSTVLLFSVSSPGKNSTRPHQILQICPADPLSLCHVNEIFIVSNSVQWSEAFTYLCEAL